MIKYLLGFSTFILILSGCVSGLEPELSISKGELALNSSFPQAFFTLRNTGEVGSTLNWNVNVISGSPRITASPDEGRIVNIGSDTFEVRVDETGLAADETLRATLEITSDGGNEAFTVVYTNTSGPEPDTSDGYLCYPDGAATGAASTLNTSSTDLSSGDQDYVPGQLLVRYETEAPQSHAQSLSVREQTAQTRQAVQREYGFQVIETGSDTSLVSLPPGQDVESALTKLNADPRVAYAEPNYYLYPQKLTNDPLLGEQWNLLSFGVPQAWDIETGQNNITIAILDSGVDLSHEDLRSKLVQGCDFFNADNDPNPGSPRTTQDQTHGTHVAGIAAARGDNGIGVAGVAYTGVKLLPVKVFNDAGTVATSAVVARAIRWAAGLEVEGVARNPNPAKVVNLSLGDKAGERIRALDEAIRDAREAGAFVIVAAGNDTSDSGVAAGDKIFAPANAPDALAVGSVDADYERSTFSSYSTSGRTVNLMAPGGSGSNSCGLVRSTVSDEARDDTYGCQAGTSMAAPFVAGVAALLWSQHPDWSVDQVEQRLLDSTLRDASMNPSEYGAGVLCADRALGAATLCGF